MGLLRTIKLIGSKKRCTDICFHYDSSGKGCSYASYDFRAKERINLGRKCLHPEWSESQIHQISLINFCRILEANSYRRV